MYTKQVYLVQWKELEYPPISVKAEREKRSLVVLTERREHLEPLVQMLTSFVKNILVMTGGMGEKQRTKLAEKIASIPADEERVVLATGRYRLPGAEC